MQSKDLASEPWAPDFLSFLKHKRQKKSAWYEEQECCDSNFTSYLTHVSETENKAIVGLMWETLAPALPFSWEEKPELEGKRVWQPRAPTNSINYSHQNGHPQLPDCQLADCHVRLGREENTLNTTNLFVSTEIHCGAHKSPQNVCHL